MGGNIKAANTSEPTVERTCSVCEESFEDTMKYSADKICSSCRSEQKDPENLNSSVTVTKQSDRKTLTIQVTLESTVHDSILVPIKTNETQDGKIIGTIRVESEDGNVWYEDVWMTDKVMGEYEVRNQSSKTFTWPIETEAEKDTRKEYQNSVGDPFTAEKVNVEFNFIEPTLENLTTSFNIPNFLIEIE